MIELLWIIASTMLVSLCAFIGIFTLFMQKKIIDGLLMFLVSLSAGALLGGAFLHLIPEAAESLGMTSLLFMFIIAGFLIFFFVEKVLHWRHCHKGECKIHTFAYMNLFGDSVHNFIDGMIIAAGFVASIPLGIATTFVVALHEIPQELGDFGVLVYGGFSKTKALFMNFLTALTAVIGGIFGYFISAYTHLSLTFLLPFAAGGFIYIAASDLIPEIRKEKNLSRSLIHIAIMILGVLLVYSMKFLEIH